MFIIYKLFIQFKENQKVMRALSLMRTSAFAGILISVFSVLKNTFIKDQNILNYKALLWALILFILMKKKKFHPMIYMLISGIIGIILKF